MKSKKVEMNKNSFLNLYNVVMYFIFLVLLGIFMLLWTFPLKWAWNFVMPSMFGVSTITYWQMFAVFFVLTSLWKVTIIPSYKRE